MEDTVTLHLDYTSYTLRPMLDVECSEVSLPMEAEQEDGLAPARGVLIGLACTLPIWALIFALAI